MINIICIKKTLSDHGYIYLNSVIKLNRFIIKIKESINDLLIYYFINKHHHYIKFDYNSSRVLFAIYVKSNEYDIYYKKFTLKGRDLSDLINALNLAPYYFESDSRFQKVKTALEKYYKDERRKDLHRPLSSFKII